MQTRFSDRSAAFDFLALKTKSPCSFGSLYIPIRSFFLSIAFNKIYVLQRLKGKITVLGHFIHLSHIPFELNLKIKILCSIGGVFHNNVSQKNVFQKQSGSSIKTNKPNSEISK